MLLYIINRKNELSKFVKCSHLCWLPWLLHVADTWQHVPEPLTNYGDSFAS